MTAYEGVLACYLSATKILNSSFAQVDEMELALLLDMLSVYGKINDTSGGKQVYIDDIL